MAETGAVVFDEFADNALLAQHLRAGEHQIGGGGAFGQLAGELEADDVGGEHVDGLAQHHRFGFDAAHAPTDDAKAVDHGGVAVGADEAVGIGDKVAVELLGLHHLDPDIRDSPGERCRWRVGPRGSYRRICCPISGIRSARVAFEFALGIVEQGEFRAELVDLHGVVDDEIDRNLRIDLGRVAAHARHLVAQRRQIHHRGHAGEVLHDHAGWFEGHLLAFGLLWLPVGQVDHVLLR